MDRDSEAWYLVPSPPLHYARLSFCEKQNMALGTYEISLVDKETPLHTRVRASPCPMSTFTGLHGAPWRQEEAGRKIQATRALS